DEQTDAFLLGLAQQIDVTSDVEGAVGDLELRGGGGDAEQAEGEHRGRLRAKGGAPFIIGAGLFRRRLAVVGRDSSTKYADGVFFFRVLADQSILLDGEQADG